MALSIVGVYGVMSYALAQRVRELGIRKALGAENSRIVRLVTVRGAAITVAGLSVGVAGAYAVAGVLRAYLYNLEPRDPATFVAALAALGIASMSACVLPALRAARVDPLVALRAE